MSNKPKIIKCTKLNKKLLIIIICEIKTIFHLVQILNNY